MQNKFEGATHSTIVLLQWMIKRMNLIQEHLYLNCCMSCFAFFIAWAWASLLK